MHVRKFNEADSAKVKSLIASILNAEFPLEKSAFPETDLDKISKVYGGEREVFYVAEDGGEVVGTIGIKEDSREVALLRWLFVHLEYRKKGIGSSLMDEAVRFCRDKNYQQIALQSTDRMVTANELCMKKGFTELERLMLGEVRIRKFILNL